MDRVLAGRRLELTYIHDRQLIDNLRRGRPVDNRLEQGLPAGALGWAIRAKTTSFNHLLMATDRYNGACEGLITAMDGATPREAFLLLDTALFAPSADKLALPSRMLALVLARAFGKQAPPAAILVRTRSLGLCEAMRAAAKRIPGAVLYPDPQAGVIPLTTASLAYRLARSIGEPTTFDAHVAFPAGKHSAIRQICATDGDASSRALVVLDLRQAETDAVLQGARKLYRARMPGLAPLPLAARKLSRAI